MSHRTRTKMSPITSIAVLGALLVATCLAVAPPIKHDGAEHYGSYRTEDEKVATLGLALENVTANGYRLMRSPPSGGRASQQRRGCHIGVRTASSFPFMSTIQIGTPPQTFEALLDTGTPISWMLHSRSQVNHGPWARAEEGPERAKFAHDQSSSCERGGRERVELKYAEDIDLNGWWVNETVRLADSLVDARSLAVRDQPLAMITHLRGPDKRIGDKHFPSAVIGLGFPSQASGNHNTLFESLLLQEHVREPVFSFYFKAGQAGEQGGDGEQRGELILGEIDRSLYTGQITWTEVTETPFWQVRVQSIRAGEATVCAHGCEAILSTGSNIIAGPRDEIEQLNQQLGFARTRADHRMFAAKGLCADQPARNTSLVFKIEDSYLEVGAAGLMTDMDNRKGGKICVSALRSLGLGVSLDQGASGRKWILGAPFVSSFYTIFNYGELKVGLAQPTRPRTLRS